ncbi:FtsX-like permease family protein [Streptococcus salivarius]|uniref:FtsX-like permease family protein n=1 Tax=Streptococcus salivarius TaxID=1304 RepID=UPI0039C228CB
MRGVIKQLLAYFRSNKLNIFILCILSSLTSFMYYFVETSIDENLLNLKNKQMPSNEQQFSVALASNKTLALSFLIGLTLVTGFVFYMFYKKLFVMKRKELGCFRALGFTKNQLTMIFVTISFVVVLLFLLIGLIIGYYYSYILLEAYHSSYGVSNLQKGLSVTSLWAGIAFPLSVCCLMTVLASRVYAKPEISILMAGGKTNKRKKIFSLLSDITKTLPSKYFFSIKVALRKSFNIFLILLSIFFYLTLIVLSFSLNMSSSQVLAAQTSSRNYNYEIILSKEKISSENNNQQLFYTRKNVELFSGSKKQKVKQNLIAVDNGKYFSLKNGKKIITLKNGEIVINDRIAQLYHFKKGDEVLLSMGNNTLELKVKAIADNGDYNSVYISRGYYNNTLNNGKNIYNGIWCDSIPKSFENETINKYSDYTKELEKNNVSNRLSAVINQILACVFGTLIIFLALLLNFQDNVENFIYLRKLGFLPKEIKKMLINIFFPIIILSFFIMIFPSIFVSKKILVYLSLQTGDYMPFSTNFLVFVYSLTILILIYYIVLAFFSYKLRQYFRRTDAIKFL